MTAEPSEKGWVLNRKRAARLMRENDLQGHRAWRRRSLTKSYRGAAPIPDLVGRSLQPKRLDTVWAGDITYIRSSQGRLYLATVIDLVSRRLISWSMVPPPRLIHRSRVTPHPSKPGRAHTLIRFRRWQRRVHR